MFSLTVRGSGSSALPHCQLYNVTPPTSSGPLGLLSVGCLGGSLSALEAVAADALHLRLAPLHAGGASVLPGGEDASTLCQASVPCLGLLLCSGSTSVTVFDVGCGAAGSEGSAPCGPFPVVHTFSFYFSVRTLAAACVAVAGWDMLLVVAGGVNGVQCRLLPLPGHLARRRAGGGGSSSSAQASPSPSGFSAPHFSSPALGMPPQQQQPSMPSLDLMKGVGIGHAAMSPSGALLAVAAMDGRLRLWETQHILGCMIGPWGSWGGGPSAGGAAAAPSAAAPAMPSGARGGGHSAGKALIRNTWSKVLVTGVGGTSGAGAPPPPAFFPGAAQPSQQLPPTPVAFSLPWAAPPQQQQQQQHQQQAAAPSQGLTQAPSLFFQPLGAGGSALEVSLSLAQGRMHAQHSSAAAPAWQPRRGMGVGGRGEGSPPSSLVHPGSVAGFGVSKLEMVGGVSAGEPIPCASGQVRGWPRVAPLGVGDEDRGAPARITCIAFDGSDTFLAVSLWDGRTLVYAKCEGVGGEGEEAGQEQDEEEEEEEKEEEQQQEEEELMGMQAPFRPPKRLKTQGSSASLGRAVKRKSRRVFLSPSAPSGLYPPPPQPMPSQKGLGGGAAAAQAAPSPPQAPWWAPAFLVDHKGGVRVLCNNAALSSQGFSQSERGDGGGGGGGSGAALVQQAGDQRHSQGEEDGGMDGGCKGPGGGGGRVEESSRECHGACLGAGIGLVPERPPHKLYGSTLAAFWDDAEGLFCQGQRGGGGASGVQGPPPPIPHFCSSSTLLIASSRGRCILALRVKRRQRGRSSPLIPSASKTPFGPATAAAGARSSGAMSISDTTPALRLSSMQTPCSAAAAAAPGGAAAIPPLPTASPCFSPLAAPGTALDGGSLAFSVAALGVTPTRDDIMGVSAFVSPPCGGAVPMAPLACAVDALGNCYWLRLHHSRGLDCQEYLSAAAMGASDSSASEGIRYPFRPAAFGPSLSLGQALAAGSFRA
jgi:hypothetical protein